MIIGTSGPTGVHVPPVPVGAEVTIRNTYSGVTYFYRYAIRPGTTAKFRMTREGWIDANARTEVHL